MFGNRICNNEKLKKPKDQALLQMAIGASGNRKQKRTAGIRALKDQKQQLLAQFVNQMVAATLDLPPEILPQCSRGKAQSARARQISIYLMHTTLSFSFTEIGKVYSKDRTTIAHACHVIEDLRDDESFDSKLTQLERMIAIVLNLSDDRKLGNMKQ